MPISTSLASSFVSFYFLLSFFLAPKHLISRANSWSFLIQNFYLNRVFIAPFLLSLSVSPSLLFFLLFTSFSSFIGLSFPFSSSLLSYFLRSFSFFSLIAFSFLKSSHICFMYFYFSSCVSHLSLLFF